MSKFVYHPLTLGLLTVASLIFSFSLHKSTQRTKQSIHNLQSLRQEVSVAQQEVLTLEQALKKADQPLTAEKIIRDELLMQKEGEYVVQIPDELLDRTQAANQVKIPSPWEEWRQLLF